MTRGRYGIFPRAAAVLCLAAWLAAGCASERNLLRMDPGLTPSTLEEGAVSIVGVTMVDEVEQIRPPLNRTLEQVLAASHPEVRFLDSDAVRERLGAGATREILFRFQQKGKLDEQTRATAARGLAPVARYALFARIEDSSIHGPGRPRPAQIRYGALGTSWTARRDARVRFLLYDLRDGTIAMDATYASSSENAISDDSAHRELPRGKPTVTGPADGPLSTPEFAPETPALADAIIEACRAFASDLPRRGNRASAAPGP